MSNSVRANRQLPRDSAAQVAMVEVVHDANMLGLVIFTQIFADRHKIGWFTGPAAVIIEA